LAQIEPQKYRLDSPATKDRLKKFEKLISPIEHKVIEANMFKVSTKSNQEVTVGWSQTSRTMTACL
jgi:hypothetical protein